MTPEHDDWTVRRRWLARGLRLRGQLPQALDVTREVGRLRPSQASASLLAAAQAAGDRDAVEEACAILDGILGRGPDAVRSDRLVRLLAARQLRRDGQLEGAARALEALLSEGSWLAAQQELDGPDREWELQDF